MSTRILALALSLPWLCAACGSSQTETETPDDTDVRDPDSSYTDAVEPLTIARVQASLEGQECTELELLRRDDLEEPEGMIMVIYANGCEGFDTLGRVAFIVSAVGNEHIQSNTLLPLPGLNSATAEAIELQELDAQRVSPEGPSVVLLRYRVEGAGGQFIERSIVATFSVEALELTVVQPTNYNLQLGGGRMTGEGTLELADADDDGDLDIQLDLSATGRGCSGPCRNGQHSCEQTSAWGGRRFSDALSEGGCEYLGTLEF